MKQILFVILCVAAFQAKAQTTKYTLRFDTTYISNLPGKAELVLLNSTSDSTNGVLTNIGKGRTAFVKVKMISDSSFTIGKDTITIRGNNPKVPNDFVWWGDSVTTVTDTVVVSSYGYNFVKYTEIMLPQFIGRRVRVADAGTHELLENDSPFGYCFTFNKATGALRIYGHDSAMLYSDSSSKSWIKVSAY